MSEVEAWQWSRYIDAYGPLNQDARLERIFARLDHGFAVLAAMMINRSGGIKAPGAPATTVGTAADPREFMWRPGPSSEELEPELTPDLAFAILGGVRKPDGTQSRDPDA